MLSISGFLTISSKIFLTLGFLSLAPNAERLITAKMLSIGINTAESRVAMITPSFPNSDSASGIPISA